MNFLIEIFPHRSLKNLKHAVLLLPHVCALRAVISPELTLYQTVSGSAETQEAVNKHHYITSQSFQ